MFEKIQHYYSIGLYTEKHLKKLYEKGALTEEQYNQILRGESNHGKDLS